MATPRKTTTRRPAAAAEANTSAAVAVTESVELNLGAQEAIATEPSSASVEEALGDKAPESQEEELGDKAPVEEATAAVVPDRASMLAKFVSPEAAAAAIAPAVAPVVKESGKVQDLSAEGEDTAAGICAVDMFRVMVGDRMHQLTRGDRIVAPAAVIARGVKRGALVEAD